MNRLSGNKPVIGLVGGIGAGKSLVARQLASLGCAVIDADRLTKRFLGRPRVRQELARWWGPRVLHESGGLDRGVVAGIVFRDPEQLRRLEGLIHPWVNRARQRLHRRYQADARCVAVVEDTPLLMENSLDAGCDVIIFVDSDRCERLRRVAAGRGWSERELTQREKKQLPLDIKARRADYIVKNDAGEDVCLLQLRRILPQILQDPA